MLPRERVKNNQPHRVPLSSAAMAVLESLTGGAGPYVLSRNGTTPLSGFSKAKRRIDALLPETIPHWTFHDLRRTAATRMARLGVALPVIEKILNHTSGSFAGMVGVYQRHDFADEKREALELWGKFVLEQVSRDRPGLSGE